MLQLLRSIAGVEYETMSFHQDHMRIDFSTPQYCPNDGQAKKPIGVPDE
jgi:hypothetical protein